MNGSAPLPTDEIALGVLTEAAKRYAAACLLSPFASLHTDTLKAAAIGYAQAVEDAAAARSTARRRRKP